jgi:ABC-2 type transport system ATP-binding protein
MNTSDLVIETCGLTKTYKGVQALRALDLRVKRNSICGFLGPNGAGIPGFDGRLAQGSLC